ncbi:uncharacterized protein A4U43_C07F1880 [Asparagus officinalis]|uniref:DNA topoisomerase I eukaryotic-type domain-containing protein n=1 Tax=Asparagus officinalis TaxID=4686 RepID=A0A5P1EAL8_ASPOF|nr:DNA topoisomerase 1-like [Asparagus officinalis]ONK62247.1 uncharacterized protein A4U43_C07F1880 [Asparagus officinalis]
MEHRWIGVFSYVWFSPPKKKVHRILNGINGIIKPLRMTLLLGPPASGKTTLLLSLAGKLDKQLRLFEETKEGTLPKKIAIYQIANKEVIIICNHQLSVSKSHDAQMSRLNEKIDELKAQKEELQVDLSRPRKGKPTLKQKKNLSPEVREMRGFSTSF